MSFTPGPWTWRSSWARGYFVEGPNPPSDDDAVSGGWPMICHLRDELGAESIANAHLIAAAPELYEALENLLATPLLRGFETAPAFVRARTALARARGES